MFSQCSPGLGAYDCTAPKGKYIFWEPAGGWTSTLQKLLLNCSFCFKCLRFSFKAHCITGFFFMNIISFFLIEKSFLSSFCRMGIIALIKLRPHPWKNKCFQVGLCYFSPNPTFSKLCLRYYLNSAATKVFSFPGTYILLLGILRGTSLLTALAAQSLFHVSVFFGFMIEMFPPFSCLYSPTGCCPSTPTSLVFAQNILLCTSPSPCSSSLSWIAMLLSKHFDKPNITSSIPKAI